MVELLGNPVWRCLTKLNMALPYDVAVMPLGIYPKELKLTFTQKPAHGVHNCQSLDITRLCFSR